MYARARTGLFNRYSALYFTMQKLEKGALVMLKEFVNIVNESVDEGYDRGITMFMENLEVDLAKQEILGEHTVDGVLRHLLTEAGVDVQDAIDPDSIDEDKLDATLKALEDEENMDAVQ